MSNSYYYHSEYLLALLEIHKTHAQLIYKEEFSYQKLNNNFEVITLSLKKHRKEEERPKTIIPMLPFLRLTSVKMIILNIV